MKNNNLKEQEKIEILWCVHLCVRIPSNVPKSQNRTYTSYRPRLFRDSRAKDGLESTLLFIRHPKTCMIITVNFQPYSKIDCFVLIDTMREGGETPLAHIAQSVERSPLKRMAAGSIPVVGIRRCLFLAERRYQSRRKLY